MVGILLGVWLLYKEETICRSHSTIYSDSQSALTLLAKQKPGSGYHYTEKILAASKLAATRYVTITRDPEFIVQWIPGHSKIVGNL